MSQVSPLESDDRARLRSLYTESFPALLSELNVSLMVSTYNWNQLIILRLDNDGTVDTQYRPFFGPMGLALHKDRLAIGTEGIIQEYRNVPSAAAKLEPVGQCDAAYLPRAIHSTGEISIHEMEWGGPLRDELWFVNTRFSCLCTRSQEYSFIPRWQPKFIKARTATDQCHLNGMCLIDGQPGYVTALGETDTAGGWRVNKPTGGILIDARSHEIVCRGLSMPHSPRWYQGKLWVLEAGGGGLGTIDLATGVYHQMTAFPGFSRGLDFVGPYAFVGLSLPRNLQIYKGLSVTELPMDKRSCGVWVVDTRSGKVVAFVKFIGEIREVFSVAVLPEYQYPDVINSDNKSILDDTFVFPQKRSD